jgi:hypothetical protein
VTFIYALIDPRTHRVGYVGKTDNPDKRLFDHVRQARHKVGRNTLKGAWLRELTALGLRPDLLVLEECFGEWQSREKYWIARTPGLLNEKSGGQIGCKPECAAKISASLKANKARHGPEWRARHSAAMKGKKASTETRSKMSAAHAGNRRAVKYRFVAIDPSGIRYPVDRLPAFCQQHELTFTAMYRLAKGDPLRKSHKGWRCEYA